MLQYFSNFEVIEKAKKAKSKVSPRKKRKAKSVLEKSEKLLLNHYHFNIGTNV